MEVMLKVENHLYPVVTFDDKHAVLSCVPSDDMLGRQAYVCLVDDDKVVSRRPVAYRICLVDEDGMQVKFNYSARVRCWIEWGDSNRMSLGNVGCGWAIKDGKGSEKISLAGVCGFIVTEIDWKESQVTPVRVFKDRGKEIEYKYL